MSNEQQRTPNCGFMKEGAGKLPMISPQLIKDMHTDATRCGCQSCQQTVAAINAFNQSLLAV